MAEPTVSAKVAAELDFRPEAVLVAYDEPWFFGRWSGYRAVRRTFIVRARTLRDLIIDGAVFERLRASFEHDPAGHLLAYCAQVVGPRAIHLPPAALEEIAASYRRVNRLPATGRPGDGGGSAVSFDAVLRRLERAPFNLEREAILDLTAAQIERRLAEWGEEKINDAKAAVAAAAAGAHGA